MAAARSLSFNWATSQQKWIDLGRDETTSRFKCFNWATSQQKWIDGTVNSDSIEGEFRFQLGHFLAEMDSKKALQKARMSGWCFNWATSQQKWIGGVMEDYILIECGFQLGHFLAEMDRCKWIRYRWLEWSFNWATSQQKWIALGMLSGECVIQISFNWATSQQKWIEKRPRRAWQILAKVSIGPLLSRNGQLIPTSKRSCEKQVSIGPLLSRNGQTQQRSLLPVATMMFQLGHFLAEMDRF